MHAYVALTPFIDDTFDLELLYDLVHEIALGSSIKLKRISK